MSLFFGSESTSYAWDMSLNFTREESDEGDDQIEECELYHSASPSHPHQTMTDPPPPTSQAVPDCKFPRLPWDGGTERPRARKQLEGCYCPTPAAVGKRQQSSLRTQGDGCQDPSLRLNRAGGGGSALGSAALQIPLLLCCVGLSCRHPSVSNCRWATFCMQTQPWALPPKVLCLSSSVTGRPVSLSVWPCGALTV